MLINADFKRCVFVAAQDYHWVASPQPGVERVMLDRIGEEQARATSVVRYAPGSRFPEHTHPGGEEILVLKGTFSADGEDFPAGWYLRNPPGSAHCPSSHEGALIFVKLRQMHPDECAHLRVNTGDLSLWERRGDCDMCPLFADKYEDVKLVRAGPDRSVISSPHQAAELLVLDGEVMCNGAHYPRGSWIRLPAGPKPDVLAGAPGATVYLKTTLAAESIAP